MISMSELSNVGNLEPKLLQESPFLLFCIDWLTLARAIVLSIIGSIRIRDCSEDVNS